jgi:hypothetical protein
MSKQEYDDRNRGVLFQNTRKEKENDPDYTGQITLPDGTKHFLSGWRHKHKVQGTYVRISIGNEKTGGKGGDKESFSKKKAPGKKQDADDEDVF